MIAIYALSCIDCPDDIYIGSTKNIKKRMGQHKHSCNNIGNTKYNRKVYKFIRENGGFENWKYHIIEEFNVYDKKQLEEREDYWMVELKGNLNTYRANRTEEQIIKNRINYREENKERIKKETIEYIKKNEAKLTAPNLCECGGEFQFKSRHRHYKTKRCTKYMKSILSI